MQTLPSALAALALLFSLPTHAADIDVENQSSWEIHEIYFSPSDEENWGEDHLGEHVLESGMTLSLTGVTPGEWDIRLVDEDEDVCVLQGVTVSASETWLIEDDDLVDCQAATEE
jgi:hypothetical protein